MNKLDYLLMDLSLFLKVHFLKFLYYFMFRDCKQCKSFCLTCKQFDECTKSVKQTYKLKQPKKMNTVSNNKSDQNSILSSHV